MAKNEGAAGYKMLGTLAAVAGAFVARKALPVIWKKVTGHEPPDKPESLDHSLGEALTWAVLSGTAVGVARVLAQRKVATTWQRANGDLPVETTTSA